MEVKGRSKIPDPQKDQHIDFVVALQAAEEKWKAKGKQLHLQSRSQ